MDQTFIKDPLHRIESLIWSYHKLQAFYYYSNYKLKIDGSVRKKYTHKTNLLVELLKFSVDNFTVKQFFNPYGIYDFPHWLICSCHIIS